MRSVSVPVIRAFDYEGRGYAVGETLAVSPAVALALSRRGVVSLDRSLTPEPPSFADAPASVLPEPEPEPVAPVRKKRQYKRRDMKAEE